MECDLSHGALRGQLCCPKRWKLLMLTEARGVLNISFHPQSWRMPRLFSPMETGEGRSSSHLYLVLEQQLCLSPLGRDRACSLLSSLAGLYSGPGGRGSQPELPPTWGGERGR